MFGASSRPAMGGDDEPLRLQTRQLWSPQPLVAAAAHTRRCCARLDAGDGDGQPSAIRVVARTVIHLQQVATGTRRRGASWSRSRAATAAHGGAAAPSATATRQPAAPLSARMASASPPGRRWPPPSPRQPRGSAAEHRRRPATTTSSPRRRPRRPRFDLLDCAATILCRLLGIVSQRARGHLSSSTRRCHRWTARSMGVDA